MIRPIVELIRLEESEHGTFGVLRICKQIFCYTLEPMDKENKRYVSSIPAQQYVCKRTSSVRFGNTFEVANVPGRDSILFHPGNRQTDTNGCILLGQYIDKLYMDPIARAVMNSGNTFKKFMEIIENFHIARYLCLCHVEIIIHGISNTCPPQNFRGRDLNPIGLWLARNE